MRLQTTNSALFVIQLETNWYYRLWLVTHDGYYLFIKSVGSYCLLYLVDGCCCCFCYSWFYNLCHFSYYSCFCWLNESGIENAGATYQLSFPIHRFQHEFIVSMKCKGIGETGRCFYVSNEQHKPSSRKGLKLTNFYVTCCSFLF